MNQPGSIDDCDDDTTLESLLSPLKRIEPSQPARQQFRVAVAAELDRSGVLQNLAASAWWKRTITVPVPVALGAAVVLLVSVGWSLSHRSTGDDPAMAAQPVVQPDAPPISSPAGSDLADVRIAPIAPRLEYYVTETYLCGVGRVKSKSGYIVPE